MIDISKQNSITIGRMNELDLWLELAMHAAEQSDETGTVTAIGEDEVKRESVSLNDLTYLIDQVIQRDMSLKNDARVLRCIEYKAIGGDDKAEETLLKLYTKNLCFRYSVRNALAIMAEFMTAWDDNCFKK